MELSTITFEGKKYPVRDILIPTYTTCLCRIGTESLRKKVIDDNGVSASPLAEDLDATIFYYVEDNELEMPLKKLRKLILENVG